jgi:hypothetical protein
MGIEGIPQEPVFENDDEMLIKGYEKSIDFHTDNIHNLLQRKTENLGRRTSGEISGIELDRLDKECDDAIEYSRKEIDSINSAIKDVRDNPTPKE